MIRNMIWIGLTGGIGSGKSTVSAYLRALGLDVVDADVLAREAVRPGTAAHAKVVAEFGADSVLPTGDLDRKKIGRIVFGGGDAGRAKLDRLEQIIHPEVRRLMTERRQDLERAGRRLAFYDVPLLFEKKMEAFFDRVLVVSCAPDIQKQRLMVREGFSETEADRRIAAQLPLLDKIRLAHDVIVNDGSLAELEAAVRDYVARL